MEVHFRHKGQTNEIQAVIFTKNDYRFNGSKQSSSSCDTADAETSQAMADILHRKKKRKRRMKL
ncbi:MAG: hypothetical protein K1V92_01960 [Bacteroides acidifaciens]|jgi:hypothetical protein